MQAIKAILILVFYVQSMCMQYSPQGTPVRHIMWLFIGSGQLVFLWLHTISIGASGWHSHLGFGKLFQLYLRDESVTSKQLESTVNAM